MKEIKRIVVAGCRDYTDYAQASEFIDMCISSVKDKYTPVFVSGTCRGADKLGERYARERGYEVEKYPADWDKYGAAAGPIRNRKMAEIADYVICFWDGNSRGTASMIRYAREMGKEIRIKRV